MVVPAGRQNERLCRDCGERLSGGAFEPYEPTRCPACRDRHHALYPPLVRLDGTSAPLSLETAEPRSPRSRSR